MATPSPPAPATLVEMLARRARRRSPAFRCGDRHPSYRDLWAASGRFAAGLAARGVGAGDRVVLALPNGEEFFTAFYGTQRAGAVPVPLFPGSGAERIADLGGGCGAALAVVPGDLPAAALRRLRRALAARGGSGAPRVAAASGIDAAGPAPRGVAPGPDDLAFLQFTSGSTGAPKAVQLTHRQVLTNARQMIAGMEITPRDVFVSWLPTCHDMGLVLMTVVPFLLAAPLVLLPSGPLRPGAWLRAVAEHAGTFTAAPDFAWRLAVRSLAPADRPPLGSLRVALNAAEPVRAETLRRFHDAFGLDRVMVPGYGLAEATVGVAMQPPGTAPAIDARGLVAIGRPFPGVTVEVVAGGRPAPAGGVGELVVTSPAVTDGYLGDAAATAALLVRPGTIRTGDLGYADAAGEVFVVGRRKNVILQAGRNLAPQEIEAAVEELDFVRRAAAVGVDRGRAEGEQAWVCAELRRAAPPPGAELREMARRVVVRVDRRLGLRPGRVLLLAPRTLPRTPNGKLRHAALRGALLDGSLRSSGGVLFP